MIVIIKESEARLLEDLRICRRENPVQRCFHLEFSKSHIPRKSLLESFLKLLQDVPDSYKAQVYICSDGDIFILMKGFMQRQFTAFLKQLAEELKTEELVDLATVLEVGVHWVKLEAICQRKIDALRLAREKQSEEHKKTIAEKNILDALNTLDPELTVSIATRRKKRPEPIVMAVDDDQITRTLVGNVIRESFNCICVPDGQSAIREYVTNAPDVLFLDIGLPDINGHDVLECLFQIDPEAYIIMFSSRKDKNNILRALETGAQGFIGKPFTRDKLFQYIKRSPHLSEQHQEGSYARTRQ